MRKEKYMKLGIGIAIVVCILLAGVSGVSGETICEGSVEAQESVSGSWDYYDAPYNWRSSSSTFFIKYDCAKQPHQMSFRVDGCQAIKMAEVRWHYDEFYPFKDIIPDSVTNIASVRRHVAPDYPIVGTVTTTVMKTGSCDGTPDCRYGVVDMLFEITITDASAFPNSGSQTLYFSVAPPEGEINDFYMLFFGQDYHTAEALMYGQQGFCVCMVRDNRNNVFGLPGGKGEVTGGVCPPPTSWSLSSNYNFKNYYEVDVKPTNITVDVQRTGGDLNQYMTKSKLRSYDVGGDVLTESTWSSIDQIHTLPLTTQDIYLVPDFKETTELYLCSYQSGNTVKIYGYTYDVETGAKLPSVTVSTLSMDYEYVDTSDVSGYYSITFPPSIYTINVNKEGHYEDILHNLVFPIGGDYELDFFLVSKPSVSAKPSILGLVRELPNYYPTKNQVVAIENVTWTTTTTTNNFGYYIFPDLEAGDYKVEVQKSGYEPNSHLISVSDFHVLHNIDLEPKEANIIRLINEWFMKWWWLLLLLIALIVGALVVKGRSGKKTPRNKR